MTQSKLLLGRDPEFVRFLTAEVGEDLKGAHVTVLSMLARLGVDPWVEASDLATMSEAPARVRLEALLARFKDVPTQVGDRGGMAIGLLAFLPRQATPATQKWNDAMARTALPRFGPWLYWLGAAVLLLSWFATLAQTS